MSTATLTRPTPAAGLPPAPVAAPAGVVVDRCQLAWALDQCARLGSRSYGLPWTSRVLLTTHPDRTLTATRSNGDADLTATIPTAAGIGGTRVPALTALRGLVALLDSDDVTLTFHPGSETLGVTAGAAAYTLACLDPNSHPAGGEERQLTIGHPLTTATVAAVRRVLPFASTDDSRPVLTAAAIGGRHAVATDSYRLAVADLGPDLDALPAVLIPAAPLGRILRADQGWSVTHHPGKAAPARLALTRDRITWRTRLLEGRWPDWPSLLPADPSAGGSVTFDRVPAMRALRRLASVAPGIPVALTSDTAELRLAVDQADGDRGVETIPATGQLGEAVAFNPRYLIDALASLTQPTATLANPGGHRPITIAEPGYRHLLMPVRL